MSTNLLRVENLSKTYVARNRGRGARAVDRVDLAVAEGEILGLVGESGCGKTTLARLLVRLLEPSSGEIWFRDRLVTGMGEAELRTWRKNVQIVFQDHLASFDPRLTIGRSIEFPLIAHRTVKGRAALREEAHRLLAKVGLSSNLYTRYPHELSGGQRQRAAIARSLALDPALIVADEPVAALDLSAQAQILNLLAELRRDTGLSCIFITHDLNVAAYLCDRIIVMYAGRIVESASASAIFSGPRHPYTQALISAALLGEFARNGEKVVLEGEPPNPADFPPGCRFNPRCVAAMARCRQVEPRLVEVGVLHGVACHLANGVADA